MRYHILDTETIGLKPPEVGSGVVEVSVREVDDQFNEVAHHFSRLDPEAPIAIQATATHGIYDEDVADCPTMWEWLYEVLPENIWEEDHEGIYFIAHNAKFDFKFLAPYVKCPVKLVDTVALARRYFPDAPNHQLQTLRVMLRLPHNVEDAHSAGGDTETLTNFVKALCQHTGMTLEELCIDAQRKDPITKIGFGKHKGKLLSDVQAKHPDYFDWLLKQDSLDPDLREAIVALR